MYGVGGGGCGAVAQQRWAALGFSFRVLGFQGCGAVVQQRWAGVVVCVHDPSQDFFFSLAYFSSSRAVVWWWCVRALEAVVR